MLRLYKVQCKVFHTHLLEGKKGILEKTNNLVVKVFITYFYENIWVFFLHMIRLDAERRHHACYYECIATYKFRIAILFF